MTCTKIDGAILCSSSEGEYTVMDHTGKTWHFEFGRFGPLILTPNKHHVSERQPDNSSSWKPFWKAFNIWHHKRFGETT